MRHITRVLGPVALAVAALVATTTPAAAASDYKATITINRSEISLGQSVVLSGKVTGSSNLKGKSVSLYWTSAAKEDDPWHKIGTTKLTSSGKYTKTFKPKDGGPTLFRVIKGAGSGHGAGKGYSDALDVFQWQYLFEHRITGNFTRGASVNGVAYRGALTIADGDAASFDTATGDCKLFRGTIAVDDDSPDDYGSLNLIDGFLDFFAVISAARDTDGRKVTINVNPSSGITMGADFGGSPNPANTMAVLGGQLYCNAPS